jgi:hypothetical protein
MPSDHDGKTAEFGSVWYGERLLPLANACINTFGGHGHRFCLYTYEDVADVPAFVQVRDAEKLFPRSKVFSAHGGWETFTDQFAYQLLFNIGGWSVDSDVVCNTSDLPDVEIAFAEERPGIINNAVLKFPAHHPAVGRLIDYVSTVDPVNGPWGITGPLALSKVFRTPDIAGYMRETADFYPLHWRQAPKLLFPEFTDEVLERTAASPFIHLWGSTLREVGYDFSRYAPIPGSYLHLLYQRYLDDQIKARLQPFDEDSFRHAVRKYTADVWNEDIQIRTS